MLALLGAFSLPAIRKALWIINTQAVVSPEQSVPKGKEVGGVKGTDEYEQQQVEAHHDGEMMSEEPGGAAGMSEEEKHYALLRFTKQTSC